MLWRLTGAVAMCALLLLPTVCAGEVVTETWRSPSGLPRAVSVNPTDGSWWMAGATSLTLFAVDDSVLAQVNGSFAPDAVATDPTDGSCWLADGGQVSHFAADGELMWTGDGFTEAVSVSVNTADGSCWVADQGAGGYYDGWTGSAVVHLATNGTELLRLTTLLGPCSVSVNPSDGSCWVAVLGTTGTGSAVVHLAADGTELWHGTAFDRPHSVSANSSDGSCWVADTMNLDVVHLSYTGTELWRGPLGLSVAPGLVAVDSSNGSCWAACLPSDPRSYPFLHLAEDGSVLWGSSGSFPNAIIDLCLNPADGSCWLVDGNPDHVRHVTTAHEEVVHEPWFEYPQAVSVDSTTGACWVADRGVHSMIVEGRDASLSLLTAEGDRSWRDPQGFGESLLWLSADPGDGTCWVGHYDPRSATPSGLSHRAADGSTLWESAPFAFRQGQPSANTNDGSCWVADGLLSDVTHLSATGTELWRGGGFSSPASASVNASDGSCWVADTGNSQVVHLAPSGVELGRLSGFSSPGSVSVNPSDGSCWVADTGHGQVVHLAATGAELWRGGGFSSPSCVSVNATDGSCWVADPGSDEVVHLAADGTQLWRGSSFNDPSSVSVNASDGSCWVADTGQHQVVRLATIPPVADFSGTPRSGDAPLAVSFTDLSTNNPSSWSWTFGDGGTSAVQHPSHTYVAAGTYTVSLTAANSGGSDTETKTGYIVVSEPLPPPPTADFSASPTTGTAPLAVDFTDLSTGDPTSWSWAFGDGGTSTARHPSHTYVTADSYTVSLTAANAGGSDTETKTDYVAVSEPPLPPPTADFSAAPTEGAKPLAVAFTDLSTGDPTSWSWEFGDGGTSTGQNPSHTYTAAGVYTVTLTATNAGGSDAETKTNYISVSFADADPEHWACDCILACVEAGIVGGYDDGLYHPELPVDRGQMAVFISRGLAGGEENVPEPTTDPGFTDVDSEHWAYKYICYAVDQHIVTGYPEGDYRPEEQVTRDQMAVYVARSMCDPTGEEGLVGYVPADPKNFPDVPSTHWAYKYVEYCVEQGVVSGYPEGDYRPDDVVTRDQMAVYIARAFGLVVE